MSCKSIRFNLTPSLGSILNRNDCKKNLNLLSNKKNEQDIHNNLNDEFNDDTSDYISCYENQEQHFFSYKLNLTKDDSTNLNSNCNQNNLKFDLNYLKLDSYDRKIFSAQDERDAMQKKTFTKWINKYLNEIGKDIDDLYEDLRDGTNLIILLQILTKKTFTKEKGNSKFHSLQNIRTCLDFLKNNRLKLVNIHSEDIFYGNPKITLGLVWILISYFQISADGMQKDEMNAQQALLNWCYENLKGYDSVRIKDFSSSWRDGKALLAILNRHRPDKISFSDSYLRSNLENLRIAFEFAENEFGVTKLLDPEDVDTDHPDEKSILTYVSMLFNAIPNIPMHPAEIQLETQKKQLMDEYSSICKSLMRWLRDSISTMDNRTVPKSLFEVKNLLNDIRNFRLEEYSIRLKEKKHLINLFNEMTSLPNSESLDLDNELSSIEKVWTKFDNYIQLRENLLEKTYKKYENLQTVIMRIEKNSENCEKILNSIENELNQATNKVLLNGHLKSFNDRLSENFLKFDQEIRKIFADCQQLIDEEHNEADIHYKKAESIQNRSLELKSKISNYQQNFKNSIEIEIHRENWDFDSKINWLEKQKSILQEQNFPSELDKIQSEIIKTKQIQEDLNQFRNDYLIDFENENSEDQFKYCLNELEILYNFTFSLTNQRLKLLDQYQDFVKQINDEIFFLDQKEQIELNRDWSNPSKLDSSNLKQYKKNLDYELESRLVVNVNPIKLLAQTMVNENHPAACHIKTYTDTMLEHFNWINELSYLLSIHLSNLIDYENFKNEHKKICDQTEQLRNNLTDIISKSNHKNYEDTIKKLDKMSMEIVGLTSKFESLSKKTKSLNSFQQRKQKLNHPYNKCRFLINYRKSQINLNKNEECIVEDNSQKTKWKIRKCDSDQSIYVPSVCLTIVSPNEEILDLIQQLKIKIDSLPKQVISYRLQFKKDRLFNIMNKIKICDFDEYEEKRKSADSNSNFDLMLSNVKYEIEELIKQSNDLNTNNSQNQHFIEYSKNDIKLLIDNYDSCCKKLNEFSNKSAEKDQCHKFEKKFHSDLECLELKLKYLMEKLAKIQQYELRYSNCSKIIDQILSQYLDFESNELRSFESELENSYNKFESFEKSSSARLINSNQMRQQLDSMKIESENLSNNSKIYFQNLNLVKNLISLLEGSNVWLTKLEERLCNQDSMKNLDNLHNVLKRLAQDLEDVASSAKLRQNEINQIRDLVEKVKASKSNLASDILNLSEIIEVAEEIKKRFSNILSQIAERQVLLGDIQHSLDFYEKAYKTETKWINTIKLNKEQNQIIHKLNENISQQQTNMQDDITELKKTFDPVAQIYTELGTRSSQVDFLNETGIQLVSQLRKFSEILTDYREKTIHQSLNQTPGPETIVNQIRSEVNNLNREYSSLLKEYNQKVKTIVNSLSKSDKQFTVHITFENAEPLIEKYKQDLFERYDLIHNSSSNYNYYYYDTNEKNLMNINSIMEPSITSKSYPINFIDAVNRKQLDLERGLFKDPTSNTFSISLAQAISKNLLSSKSAHITDPQTLRSSDLLESINSGLITAENQVLLSPNFTLSLADALKTGHLKIGEVAPRNCSISSETQSMSIRSIKDPKTGEFLVPTEAIKRKLLDPYKGLFYNTITNEKISITEAIQKGFVLVEVNHQPSVATVQSDRDQNVVSTSLIRETKSYHLLAVFDPIKNDEITIKEAISRGILDRKRGIYVHPQTKETFSISDAINKGVIRARILKPPANNSQDSYQTLISTTRFEENRSYTITGAIDPRNGTKISLFQAIKDGIIDPKNGCYVNITNGETIAINKAIENKLVLTDKELNKVTPVKNAESPRTVEIKTLNIEYVKDPRTGRNISVSEAIQIGLLDKNTLNYNNPLNQQSLSLNKAYEKGLIIGHYTESYNQSYASSVKREEQSYFIVDIYDPISNKSLNLDQAIQEGLFDHSKGVYVHPVNREEISIGEAVRKGLINAQIFAGEYEPKRFDSRLPVGNFGIDKKIRSMRTKFNKDGTSVLQIDIESTKPVKGVYEVDEIEELTCNEPIVDKQKSAQRQVIDINSVHRLSEQAVHKIDQLPINNVYREKNIVNIAINKEIGADFDIKRIEDVLDDDRSGVIRINVDKNNNKQIVERKNIVEKCETIQPLIIDDSNSKLKQTSISIDGQKYVHKNEIQIVDLDASKRNSELFNMTQQSVRELDQRLRSIEREKNQQIKVKSAEIVDNYTKRQSSYFNIEPDTLVNKERRINVTVDIKTETKPQSIPLQEIYDEKPKDEKKYVYEDTTIIDRINVPAPSIPAPQPDEEDEETFEEWTEVYTITIRGIRYKIIWVYDPLKCENVTLIEAIKRGILDLNNGVYHNLKTSHSLTVNEAIDDGLIGIEEDTSALTIKVNGITYTIYWVWDPVKRKRISPKRAIDRNVLDLENKCYRNYANNETISIHEAVYMKLIGASDDLTNIEEELTLEIENCIYRICWVKDSRTGEKYKPREALRRGLLDLTNYYYNKYDTNQTLTIKEAIRQGFIGLSDGKECESSECSSDSEFERQDSLSSLDDEELTIKTKTAIYVITGLVHPETQKEIKVSDAIKNGILDKDNGTYKDFKTNVTYEVGEAINEGFVFATVTDLLQDETASTEFIREEIKRFIVKSVIDPRTKQRIGGLQAQAAGILNYAQGMYTNPDNNDNMSITEAINRNLIEVTLQEETSHEEFDAEVITETLMERTITVYRIVGVVDPFSNEIISASDAVHRQIIDTETNSYVDASSNQEPIPIREAVRRNLIRAETTERIERKPLGVTLQNAIRLGLFNPESGKFKDLYTNKYFDLNQAVEKGHINPNGAAVAESSTGSMTLNEAFKYSIFNKKTGVLDRTRLAMFKAKMVEAKIYKWNFEDAVKCGLVCLKNAKYKHQQTGELISIKDAINRGLIDGESVILDDVLTGTPMTLRQALESKIYIDNSGNIIDVNTSSAIMSLEQAFNTRKIYSAFDENTGEIFLVSLGKIVPFEKAIRKNKMDKSIRIFDPRSNKDLTISDSIERCLIDKTSGMVIDPKGCGGLLSIKEAVKRGILSITGAPLVTGHHNSETIEAPIITSRKSRHILHHFDDISEPRTNHHHHHQHQHQHQHTRHHKQKNDDKSKSKSRTSIIYDSEYLNSDLIRNNPSLISGDPSTVTNFRQTNEEHRKKISGSGIKETLKADYKETVIRPGQLPVVTSSANYEKELKNNLDDNSVKNLQTRFSVKSSDQDSFDRIYKFVDDLIYGVELEPTTSIKKIINRRQMSKNLDPSDKDLMNFLQFYKNKFKEINDIDFISEVNLSSYDKE